MDKLTPDMLMTFLIVAAALAAFALLILNIADKIRAARRPAAEQAEWRSGVDAKLDSDKKRIDSLEDGQKVMLRGINAIISHEIISAAPPSRNMPMIRSTTLHSIMNTYLLLVMSRIAAATILGRLIQDM